MQSREIFMILEASKETKFTNSNNWYEVDHKISYTYVVAVQ